MSMPMSAKGIYLHRPMFDQVTHARSVLRPLYKNLVRLAKRFDTNPVLKLHNTQHRSQYYNPGMCPPSRCHCTDTEGDFSCVQVIRALFRRALLQASTVHPPFCLNLLTYQ